MIEWLRRLPDAIIFIAVLGSVISLTAAAPYVGSLIWRRRRETNSEGYDSFVAVASAAAVLLAFSLVQVDTSTRAVEDAVSKEAAAINSTDRVLTRYGDPQMSALRTTLHDYAVALIEDEWPQLAHGGRSEKADNLYTSMSRAVRALDPPPGRQTSMYGELLKYIDDVTDLREQRINAASLGLPSLFWLATGLMLFIMLLLVARLTPNFERAWTTTAIAAAIGVIISLILIVDAPFHGETGSVTADAIQKALVQMGKRQ